MATKDRFLVCSLSRIGGVSVDTNLLVSFCCFLLIMFLSLLDPFKKTKIPTCPQRYGEKLFDFTHSVREVLIVNKRSIRKSFFNHLALFHFSHCIFSFNLHTDLKINGSFSRHQTTSSPFYKKLLQSYYQVDPTYDHSFTNYPILLSSKAIWFTHPTPLPAASIP
jgi:hypothetical protein